MKIELLITGNFRLHLVVEIITLFKRDTNLIRYIELAVIEYRYQVSKFMFSYILSEESISRFLATELLAVDNTGHYSYRRVIKQKLWAFPVLFSIL